MRAPPAFQAVLRRTNDQISISILTLPLQAETDRLLFEDPDPETGFMLHPDLKWVSKPQYVLPSHTDDWCCYHWRPADRI